MSADAALALLRLDKLEQLLNEHSRLLARSIEQQLALSNEAVHNKHRVNELTQRVEALEATCDELREQLDRKASDYELRDVARKADDALDEARRSR